MHSFTHITLLNKPSVARKEMNIFLFVYLFYPALAYFVVFSGLQCVLLNMKSDAQFLFIGFLHKKKKCISLYASYVPVDNIS